MAPEVRADTALAHYAGSKKGGHCTVFIHKCESRGQEIAAC
ncbi:hypothetical protein TERTU_1209 [Teredinibacter turnerae T7901]|uniref:Uncharacterized protein n=1 Tax=Teredinibacter turnerae (strain ATCC 39867 / T7901) TaxID=377629 RepID=C5BRQ6_TERTT|nr:hypothetical protein TERTU_1209 [Teredinibacter turnerae T7901]